MAPAKVNLHLAVKNRRPDGFHNLESVFLAVNFGDILHFSQKKGNPALKFTGKYSKIMEDIPLDKNIIFKAQAIFREKTGFNEEIYITAEKNIPVGGGLGGGSSDAAAVLLAMNKIAGFPLKFADLLQMGEVLGSDVPFFLYETPAAWVTGRGEHIEPIELPPMFLVLLNPGFPSNTAAAFKLLDSRREEVGRDSRGDAEAQRTRRGEEEKGEEVGRDSRGDAEAQRTRRGEEKKGEEVGRDSRGDALFQSSLPLLSSSSSSSASSAPPSNLRFAVRESLPYSLPSSSSASSFKPSVCSQRLRENLSPHNDFLEILPERAVYNEIISRLQELGAEFAGLSGTGSTCFGVFRDWKQAQEAANALRGDWEFVQECAIINYEK